MLLEGAGRASGKDIEKNGFRVCRNCPEEARGRNIEKKSGSWEGISVPREKNAECGRQLLGGESAWEDHC